MRALSPSCRAQSAAETGPTGLETKGGAVAQRGEGSATPAAAQPAPPDGPTGAEVDSGACPRQPTGAELLAEIEAAAAKAGVAASRFAAPLSRWPRSLLSSLAAAKRPKLRTIERVRALCAGDPVPPSPHAGYCAAAVSRGEGHTTQRFSRALATQVVEREEIERKRRAAEDVRETRAGRISQVVAEEAAEAADRRACARSIQTISHVVPSPARTMIGNRVRALGREVDADMVEADELAPTPQSLIRRACRELPKQWAEIRALAAELGEMPGEVMRQALDAGIKQIRKARA